MTLWFVLGTAAELIKVYPLIQAAQARRWPWKVVATGQSGNNFWRQYDNFSLSRENSQTLVSTKGDLEHSGQAGKWFINALLQSPRTLLTQSQPQDCNWVVVHGDTLSTLIGALWAKRLGWPVAHVEAGLRSANWWQPFPEEICRRLVSRLTQLHFAPDQVASNNLRNIKGVVVNTQGNSLMDAVHLDIKSMQKTFRQPLCLVNLHRFENLNSALRWQTLIDTTLEAAKKYHVVFVMHPQTEHKIRQSPLDQKKLESAGVQMVPRMMFADFIGLVKQAEFLISDGGSNQEETYYLGVPCLLLRETTERREGLDSTAVLSRFDKQVIAEFLANPQKYRRAAQANPISPTHIMLDWLEKQSHEQ